MAPRTHLKLSPLLLRWARQTSGLAADIAAKRIGLRQEKLEQWEAQEATPTARQLEKVADVYKRPVASFFLSVPPEEPPLPVDFRSAPEGQAELSAKTRFAIRKARWLQSVYAEMAAVQSFRLAEIPTVRNPDAQTLASAMRDWLAVAKDQVHGKQPSAALNVWRSALEANGVLAFQFSIPVAEARAFSLIEQLPVVVLSSKDSYAARIFSSFHELAHLLLRRPGLCIPELGRPRKESLEIERLCNAAAGLALVPTANLLSHSVVASLKSGADLHDSLEPMARSFGVSRQVVLRRLVDVGVISWTTFGRMMDVLKAEFEAQEELKKKRTIIVSPGVKALAQLGKKVVTDALKARSSGAITDADLAEFLGLKLQHVPEVEAMVEVE